MLVCYDIVHAHPKRFTKIYGNDNCESTPTITVNIDVGLAYIIYDIVNNKLVKFDELRRHFMTRLSPQSMYIYNNIYKTKALTCSFWVKC